MPKPRDGEKRKDYLSRCMGDKGMNKEFPEQDQRYAVCQSYWDRKDKKDNAHTHDDCECGGTCNECKSVHHHTRKFKINFDTSTVRRTVFEKNETLIVPVVMLKAGVVMNDALVKADEIIPESWNGVPVTVSHPLEGANTPENITEHCVGRIFHAHMRGGDLRAEAWIDIAKANEVLPGLVEALEQGVNMDVSTGYLARDVEAKGTSLGRTYHMLHTEIRPDHLALLPNEEGACNWQDGCGVRANRRLSMNAKVKDAFSVVAKHLGFAANERGENPDDRRLVIADLISNDASPFCPDDEDSLRMMTQESLLRMRNDYIGEGEDDEPAKEKANRKVNMTSNNGDKKATLAKNAADFVALGYSQDEADKLAASLAAPAKKEEEDGLPKTKAELDTLVQNAVKAAAPSLLSAEDRAALDRARQIDADHRNQLIDKIVSNSAMKKEDVEKMPVSTLETIANGIHPVASYEGRNVPELNANSEKDDVAEGMVPPSLETALKQNRDGGSKKEAA